MFQTPQVHVLHAGSVLIDGVCFQESLLLQGMSNATLCVDPAKVGAQVAVFDPLDRLVAPLGSQPAVTTFVNNVSAGRSASRPSSMRHIAS